MLGDGKKLKHMLCTTNTLPSYVAKTKRDPSKTSTKLAFLLDFLCKLPYRANSKSLPVAGTIIHISIKHRSIKQANYTTIELHIYYN